MIVIRLDRYGPDPAKQVLLTIWRYPHRDAPARQVSCEPGPHAVRRIEKIVTDVLAREIPHLPPGRPMIEFALPDHILDRAVEKWTMNGWPLGTDYPIVVRFADRHPVEEHAWQSRERQFRSGRLPKQHSPWWADFWIACGDQRDSAQLNGMLQRNGQLPFIAMTAWHHGKPVPRAVAAARHAGAAVIVWQHEPCADRQAGGIPAGKCRGHRFREAVAEYLSEKRLDQLPEAVWQVRAGAAAKAGNSEYPGHGIAILWDDPDRLPWADAPRNHPPS